MEAPFPKARFESTFCTEATSVVLNSLHRGTYTQVLGPCQINLATTCDPFVRPHLSVGDSALCAAKDLILVGRKILPHSLLFLSVVTALMADISVDTTTQSNYADIATQHVTFDWSIDFDAKVLTGSATHDMKLNKDGVGEAMYVIVGSFDFTSLNSLLALILEILISAPFLLMEKPLKYVVNPPLHATLIQVNRVY